MQRADIFHARPTHPGPVSQRIWTPLDLDPDSGYEPPSAYLDPATKLSEKIIVNVLVKTDDTLRSSAY